MEELATTLDVLAGSGSLLLLWRLLSVAVLRNRLAAAPPPAGHKGHPLEVQHLQHALSRRLRVQQSGSQTRRQQQLDTDEEEEDTGDEELAQHDGTSHIHLQQALITPPQSVPLLPVVEARIVGMCNSRQQTPPHGEDCKQK
jgi:small-conductance mechanosensitive channel